MDNKKLSHSIIATFLMATLAFSAVFAAPDSAKVRAWNVKTENGKVEVAIQADGPVQYRAIRVTDPEQALVFEVYPAVLWGKKETRPVNQGNVKDARIAQFSSNPDVVRVVLDLTHPMEYTANLSGDHHRLSIALNEGAAGNSAAAPVVPAKTASSAQQAVQAPTWSNVKIEKRVVSAGNGFNFVPGLTAPPRAKSVSSSAIANKYQEILMARAAKRKRKMLRKWVSGVEYIDWQGTTDLQSFVRQMAEKMGLNAVVDSAVHGTVNLQLKHVQPSQALAMVLAINGYSSEIQGNFLIVSTKDKLANLPTAQASMGPQAVQVIPLEYAKASDLSATVTSEYPSVQVSVGPTNELVVKGPISDIKKVRDLVSELDKAAPPPVPPQKAVIQLNYSDVKDVLSQLKPLLPADAVLIADDRLNAIIAIGSPYDIDTVKSFVSAVDVPSPQVMLAMQVISVNIENSSNIGVGWPGAATTTFTEAPSGPLPPEGGTAPTADTGSGGGAVLNNLGFHTFVRDNLQLITSLNWLVQHSFAKVLGAPRIATVNDKQASIQLGQRVPVVYFDPRAGLYQVQYIDVGVILNITPHISPDGYITVHVNPTVSEVTGFVQNFPQLETRQADTTVRVKNGQTIVIGGLLNESTTDTLTKIPLLGDIPIIGELFRHDVKDHTKTDLVVSITPTLLSEKY